MVIFHSYIKFTRGISPLVGLTCPDKTDQASGATMSPTLTTAEFENAAASSAGAAVDPLGKTCYGDATNMDIWWVFWNMTFIFTYIENNYPH